MKQTEYWNRAIKWALIVIVPMPFGFAAMVCLFEVFGEKFWGGLKSTLFNYYYTIGLTGVPYLFSWSINTVEMVLGLPYSWFLLIARALLWDKVKVHSSRSMIVQTIETWSPILVLPVLSVPLTLVLLRIFLFTILDPFGTLLDRIHFESMYWRLWTMRFFLYAFPCGLVALALQHVFVKIRDSPESPSAPRPA